LKRLFPAKKGLKEMDRKSVLAVSAMLVLATSVDADDGLYAAVGGGISFAQDTDFSEQGVTVTAELDTGFLIDGAIGYQLQAFRLEGEFTYLRNSADKFSAFGVSIGADGDQAIMAGLANVYFDIPTQTPWTPYVGGGLGFANVGLNDVSLMGIPVVDDDDSVFAYQVKAGLGYRFSPATDVTAGYRFFGTDDVSLKTVVGDSFQGDGPLLHNFELGLRYRF
jgi:opacity protein-like surface antigen